MLIIIKKQVLVQVGHAWLKFWNDIDIFNIIKAAFKKAVMGP